MGCLGCRSEIEHHARISYTESPDDLCTIFQSQNLRGEGNMDEIIGMDADDDDTIFGKKARKRSGKGFDAFFSIAMAKVATLHWLNSTGKASLVPAQYLW